MTSDHATIASKRPPSWMSGFSQKKTTKNNLLRNYKTFLKSPKNVKITVFKLIFLNEIKKSTIACHIDLFPDRF